MFEQLKSIILSVEFWKIMAPALVAIMAWMLNERSKREWEKFQIKKDACLRALNIANAVLSNYEYPNVKKGDLIPQYESVENTRACFNELACTCKKSDVINELKKIMFDSVTPAAIVDLRAAVRKELGFSKEIIDIDCDKAFIAKANCEMPKNT